MPGTTSLGLKYPVAGDRFQDSVVDLETTIKQVDSELVGRATTGHTHGNLSTLAQQQAYQNDIDAQRWMQVAP